MQQKNLYRLRWVLSSEHSDVLVEISLEILLETWGWKLKAVHVFYCHVLACIQIKIAEMKKGLLVALRRVSKGVMPFLLVRGVNPIFGEHGCRMPPHFYVPQKKKSKSVVSISTRHY